MAMGKKLLAKRAKKEQVSASLTQLNRDIYDLEKEIAKKYPAKVETTTTHILHVTRKIAQETKQKKGTKEK